MDRTPLLHPVDVQGGRRPYAISVCLRVAASPHIFVALVLVLCTVSNNIVTPLLGPFVGLLVCAYVERRYRADAWANIARRSQDVTRDEPRMWAAMARTAQASALATAIVVFVVHPGAEAFTPAAGSLVSGVLMGLAAGAVATATWDRVAPPAWRVEPTSPAVAIPAVGVTLLLSAMATTALLSRAPWDQSAFFAGAAICVSFTAAALSLRAIPAKIRCAPMSLIDR